MQQWSEWERQQTALLKGPKVEYITCVGCGSTWMEIVQVAQFDRNKISVLGQTPFMEASFSILRCVRCGELHEPPVNRVFSHPETKKYDELLDTLQADKATWSGTKAGQASEPSKLSESSDVSPARNTTKNTSTTTD